MIGQKYEDGLVIFIKVDLCISCNREVEELNRKKKLNCKYQAIDQ